MGEHWLQSIIGKIDSADIDIQCIRNWRIILVSVGDTQQQIAIHDICDNHGASHTDQYLLDSHTFMNGIQGWNRGDIVRFGSENRLGKIFEISAFDKRSFGVSPYKCVSIVCLNEYNRMNIYGNMPSFVRVSPWQINTKVCQAYSRGNLEYGKRGMIEFLKCELIAILPLTFWSDCAFEEILDRFVAYVSDEREVFHPSVSVEDIERELYAIKRDLSYAYLCLESDEIKDKYAKEFIDVCERIISLAHPMVQSKLVTSVLDLVFP